MEYLPLHFKLDGSRVLVVGGGSQASNKAALLVRAGARILFVAPQISSQILALGDAHDYQTGEFEPAHLDGVSLVVAATDNAALNAAVAAAANLKGTPVNVVDSPDLCTVIFPAIIDRSPVLVSVGTGGASPVLARSIREMIEGYLPEGLGRLGQFLRETRPVLKKRFSDIQLRRKAVEKFMVGPGQELAQQGDYAAAERYLYDPEDGVISGEVYLVGAGPGDPDLLTLKALQLMQKADVILYDNLVSEAILSRARRDAQYEFVGKRSGYLSASQESINALLVRLAKSGKSVLRLKGGDPFIFGRGGEELEQLIEAGIPFQVIPGITAASGCAAYAGIPLTHRDYAQSVRFITGHPKNSKVQLPWHEFVSPGQTLVFYMGLAGLPDICKKLIAHGQSPETPVAVISKGTTPEQKMVTGSLGNIAERVLKAQLVSPTLIIVGQVVSAPSRLQGVVQ
ncbi:MAG: uroporphyrinogen-III C-methyltransferase [Gammaproteobacteria bacterium]|nr:uroporphyrinogen-III C-methyltransferase [Gammaproteobacteria bacterium]